MSRSSSAAVSLKPESRCVLVVDDDPMILRALRLMLESDGHSVTIALGGEAGIAEFLASSERSQPFPVVMTDLGMPNVDGLRVASAVKAAAPETLVCLLTGCVERLEPAQLPADVDLVLAKPPSRREMREALMRRLAAAAP